MQTRFTLGLVILLAPVLLAPLSQPGPIDPPPPRFRTWHTNPGYYHPAYPLVFVASYRDPSIRNSGNFGSDAVQVGAPQGGQELWIMLTNGKAKKLFPIEGVHEALVDETLAPRNGRILGAVTEPSISIDGKRAYFTYFHNATDAPFTPDHSSFAGWPKGGDLYVVDLTPVLNDITFPVANLQTSRLTFTQPEPMNPTQQVNNAGVVYTGAVEIDNAYGRQLLFASTRRMLDNADTRMARMNKNYNLFTADIELQAGSYALKNIKQAQYYTTTAGISPSRMRVGYAFSYQANTEEARQWHIQQVVGHEWRPLFGYGGGNELAHLSTFCVKNQGSVALPAGDYALVTRYYNQNNNGFGAVIAQEMAFAGLNNYNTNFTYGKIPSQLGSDNKTQNVPTGDVPSSIGKFTTPACGGPDELYLAYDPGTANHKNGPYNYQPKIVFTDLEPANPGTQPGAYQDVIKGYTDQWAALWPQPVIDWVHRLTGTPDPEGDAEQERPPSPIESTFNEPAGKPYALLGTSALYNTDITPVDCRALSGWYDPFISGDAHVDNLYNNIEGLSRLMDQAPGNIQNQTGTCKKPTAADVFGIAVYMTSNRTSEAPFTENQRGYTTDGGFRRPSGDINQPKESKRLLGVFQKGMKGQSDTSFKAIVPANVPLDFQLLGANGAKLADVRSWHSLKPREQRVNCGGCHNHRPGQAVDWNTSDSASPAVLPLDMVRTTTRIEYDGTCQPTIVTLPTPVDEVPTWQNLSADFDSYCGGCHEQLADDPLAPNARNAFSYEVAKLNVFDGNGNPAVGNPLYPLFKRKYIDRYNANGSPMFWAAYGERTDGRNNSLPQYQPDQPNFSTCSDIDPRKCGYVYTGSHDNLETCNGRNPNAAKWVYRLSQWIDNHAPIDVPGKPASQLYQADRYHPTVEGALIPNGSNCSTALAFRVGFWDDSGGLVELDIDYNGSDYRNETTPANLENSDIYVVPLTGADLTPFSNDVVKVTAVDPANNRQVYQKTIGELIQECIAMQ